MKLDPQRRRLALRLFGAFVLVNGVLWLLFAPSPTATPAAPTLPQGHVELKVRGVLHGPLVVGMRVLLGRPDGPSLGPATVLSQDADTLLLAIPEELYRRHHVRLATQEWSLLPYLDGMLASRPPRTGVTYEIAY
jgi:hypothetical protein